MKRQRMNKKTRKKIIAIILIHTLLFGIIGNMGFFQSPSYVEGKTEDTQAQPEADLAEADSELAAEEDTVTELSPSDSEMAEDNSVSEADVTVETIEDTSVTAMDTAAEAMEDTAIPAADTATETMEDTSDPAADTAAEAVEDTSAPAADTQKEASDDETTSSEKSEKKKTVSSKEVKKKTVRTSSGENQGTSLPEDLTTMTKGTLYVITSYEQWIALANYSKGVDLYGYRFCYDPIEGSQSSDNTIILDFTSQSEFDGLGSEAHPFAGELFSNYAVGNITLKVNKPMFTYLSSKANISNIQVQTSNSVAGLAEYLVADDANMTVNYKDITVLPVETTKSNFYNYNVRNDSGCAGGLFAHVVNENEGTLKINGTDINVSTTVMGVTAGGLIGEVVGNMELDLTGFTFPDFVQSKNNTTNVMGGLIGFIHGRDDKKMTFTLTSSATEGIVYTHRDIVINFCPCSGGLFGKIENVDFTINASLKYVGKHTVKQFDIKGDDVGVFAGRIENSNIILNAPFECQNVLISNLQYPVSDAWEEHGLGMFAGVLTNSAIYVGSQFPSNSEQSTTPAIIVSNPKSTSFYNCYNYESTSTQCNNIGGIIGYAYNSDLNFTQEHPCVVKSFSTTSTRGNVGGAIGLYKATDKNHVVKHVKIDNVEKGEDGNDTYYDTRLVGRKGNTGGLIACIKMKNAEVLISGCGFNGILNFALSVNYDTVMSSIIARAETETGSVGKLILENIKCYSNLKNLDSTIRTKAYGTAIGVANTDFEITGDDNYFVNTGSRISEQSNKNCRCDYYGGLIGIVQNDGSSIRKGSVHNVRVGKNQMDYFEKAYGGLFGIVEEKSAISLSGHIWADKSAVENGADNATQTAYHNDVTQNIPLGSIAGIAKQSLLYMEPDTDFKASKSYTCDEIGNYGGVIRNGYWDAIGENKGELLIENYQVNGTLTTDLKTAGDMLRLAIALNTDGTFLPIGNQTTDESSTSLNSADKIRAASYTLSASEYDLSKSGLMCLSRNDKEGIKKPFTGSFTGLTDGKAKIIYNSISYIQPYIGLFPAIDGGETGSCFKNLELEYNVIYKRRKYSNKSDTFAPKQEYAGGLAAVATGNITVDNVSYTGTLTDTSNSVWNSTNQVFEEKQEDYLGGIFGTYQGADNTTLTIEDLSANMTLSYNDFTHVVGGVIGYVNLDSITDGQTCKVNIGDSENSIQLKGTIKIGVTAPESGAPAFAARESGMITQIGNPSRVGQYDTKCNLKIQGVTVDGLSISETASTVYSKMGGFLGEQWMDVDAQLINVKVGETTDTELSGRATFGGLVHTVQGKMQVNNVSIGAKTRFSTKDGTGIDQCALLVQDGRYLYLDVRDYTVASGVKLSSYNGSYFDELVGVTKGGDDANHGGIVSVGYNETDKYYLGRNQNTYASYVGGHVVDASDNKINKNNPNTRYYYDVNKLEWNVAGVSYGNLDSADAVYKWHLLHYANACIRKCLDSGYSDSSLPNSYTIGDSIDLSGYSIYPTPVTNETYTGGSIILNAQAIIDDEKAQLQPKYPETEACQHYQMQAGVFSSVSGITVDGLKLGGNYSIQNQIAGALVAGSIYGVPTGTDANGKTVYDTTIENTFTNITLNNLWCVSQSTIDYAAPIGLMIADISSGAKVTLAGIAMTGYTDDAVANGKAASALMGNVGGTDATYIALNFKNMDIADAATGKSSSDSSNFLNSSTMDEALAKASFIYSYDYVESCSGVYTFTYDDYYSGRCIGSTNKMVTLGEELGNNNDGETPNYALEEYFDWDEPVGKMQGDNIGIEYNCKNYIPYVYTTTKKLLINPKVGHLTAGCGTYEDPYVIETARELITLYRYLYEEDKFRDVLISANWSMNPVGDDSRLCDRTNTTGDDAKGHGASVVYKEELDVAFPTKEQLSQAYYQIADNIDISDYSEFTGFGKSDLPFVGVFVGKKTESQGPVIVLPEENNSFVGYGWIQYAKGCVVKDLEIQFSQTIRINNTITSEDNGETVNEGGAGGGVIATVLGGDNIIDNVTVKGQTEEIACFQPGNTKAMIGGYVGAVNAGGVILRNLSESNLSGFKVSLDGDISSELEDYWYTCGIIGRVYDGYVVYDGAADHTTPLLRNMTGVYSNSNLEPNGSSRSYDIINGSYLENTDSSKMTWVKGTGYTIYDAKQLQVISMALNSGLFNYDDGDSIWAGYNKMSRQRSGNYDYVGAVGAEGSESAKARNKVIQNDNLNQAEKMAYYGYLSRYFENWENSKVLEFTDGTSSYNGSNAKAVLNPVGKALTYTLSGTDYDMSVYGSAFHGLGARYFEAENPQRANEFHSHLKGASADNAARITLNMDVDGIQECSEVALLNPLIGMADGVLDIAVENIVLSGTVSNHTDIGASFSTVEGTANAAGIVSIVDNVNLTLTNVKLDGLQVKSQKYAGGMVAYNKSGVLTFQNCGITGTSDAKSIQGCADTGGFVGYTQTRVVIDAISSLAYLDVESIGKDTKGVGVGKNAGGLIGTAEYQIKIDGNGIKSAEDAEPFVGTDITVKTTGNKKDVQIGGLVGRAGGDSTTDYAVSDITLKNLTVENTFKGTYESNSGNNYSTAYETKGIIGTGGIVGSVYGKLRMTNVTVGSTDADSTVVIQNTDEFIPYRDYDAVGGLLGKCMKDSLLQVTNCNVLGVKKEDGSYTTKISGHCRDVGGISGNGYDFTGVNLEVNGVFIDAGRTAGGIISWKESENTCTLTNVSVKNSKLVLGGKYVTNQSHKREGYVGGLIGRGANISFVLTGVKIESTQIESDYGEYVGGYFGYMYATNLTVCSKENTISDCILSGRCVGGVVGKADCNTSKGWTSENGKESAITITGNKFISCREDLVVTNTTFTDSGAGGFAGNLVVRNQFYSISMENITIQDNLIATYDSNGMAQLGGVSGITKMEAYFNHVLLKDNYIGMMKLDKLPEDKNSRTEFIANTNIVGSGTSLGLRDYLYYVTYNEENGSYQIAEKDRNDIDSKQYYQYAYLQGAAFGVIKSDASLTLAECNLGIPRLTDAHITYTEKKYRPVSDVGAATDTVLTSNEDMYDNARKRCVIVYDGRMTEEETLDMKTAYNAMGITYDKATPYVFGNLEQIMDAYQSTEVDRRQAYRLDDNFQNGEAINRNAELENYNKLTVNNIYANTYKKETGEYYSPVQTRNGITLPMIVYNSTENGSLDQVIQTYINILTNNSGALNSYVNDNRGKNPDQNAQVKYSFITSVTTHAAKFENDTITITKSTPSVSVESFIDYDKTALTKYRFLAGVGDEWDDTQKKGTFTFVEIHYGKSKRTKTWTLIIPVYVEKRLQVNTNMKMLEGIQYDTSTIKANGLHVLTEDTQKNFMTLTRGNSYSIYTEYIYRDYEKFASAQIPKSLCIKTDAQIYFSPGTKITMIPLDEGGRPYYYTIGENDTKNQKIDFTAFKDASGNSYTIQDVIASGTKKGDYTDICGTAYDGESILERYVLLVDTSDVTASRANGLYEMHMSLEDLETQNKSLFSRTDYLEHCYEYINEIDGVTYHINTDKEEGAENANTYLVAGSKVSNDSSVKVHLQYNIKASETYWKSTREAENTYMDIGFYLSVKENNAITKIPLPSGTTIALGTDNVTIPAASGQTITYYYQGRRKAADVNAEEKNYVFINELKANTSGEVDVAFDFSNADMSEIEKYSGQNISIVAEIVTTTDKDRPAGGEVKDSWEAQMTAEAKKDIGFALEVDDLVTLGMNQYEPDASDSGVVSYTASIAFPDTSRDKMAAKYYTMVYQIEEKTAQKAESTNKPVYTPYTGDAVSLYLGKMTNEVAKAAAVSDTNSVKSGNGIVAVTYQFSTANINAGVDLQDGQTPSGENGEPVAGVVPGVVKTHCTLVANCDGLNMTNYRVRAYLLVSDEIPNSSDLDTSLSNAVLEDSTATESLVKGAFLRSDVWTEITGDSLTSDVKNDFFVFTVAKIKNSMQ